MRSFFFINNIIVFGFFNESFVGVEQGQGHTVQVGYLKGAESAGVYLLFNVVDIPGTASEFTVSCFEESCLNKSVHCNQERVLVVIIQLVQPK